MDESVGYDLIDPGLSLPGTSLTDDERVRCLSYIIGRMKALGFSLLVDRRIEVIPVRYVGAPYPCIGIVKLAAWTASERNDFNRLERFAQQIAGEMGIEGLKAASMGIDTTWESVCNRFIG